MVKLHPVWNSADEALIGIAVTRNPLTINLELRVLAIVSRRYPLPAPVIENAHLVPEASRQAGIPKGKSGRLSEHRNQPFGVGEPDVYGVAAPI